MRAGELLGLDAGVTRATCRDGQVIGTADSGQSWVRVGRLEKAAAIRWTSTTRAFALADQGDCRAAVLETVDRGVTWSRQTCLGAGKPLAIDVAGGDTIAAQVGTQLHVSTDSGATWQVR